MQMGTQPTEVVVTAPAASFPTFGIALIVVAVLVVVVVVLVLAIVILVLRRRPGASKKPRCVFCYKFADIHVCLLSVSKRAWVVQ